MGSLEQHIASPTRRSDQADAPAYQAFDIDASSEGGFEGFRTTLFRCEDCAAVVANRDDHTRWHQHLTAALRAAAQTADARLWSDR